MLWKKYFVRTLVRLVRWLVRFGGFGALCAGLYASLVRWPCALALCAQPGLVLRLHACIPVARVSTGFSKDSLCIHCPVCRGLHIVLSDRLTGVYIDLCASKGLCAALCVEGALCVCFRLLCFWLCAPFVRLPVWVGAHASIGCLRTSKSSQFLTNPHYSFQILAIPYKSLLFLTNPYYPL